MRRRACYLRCLQIRRLLESKRGTLGSGSDSDGEAGTRGECSAETGSTGHPQERQHSAATGGTRDRVPPARSTIETSPVDACGNDRHRMDETDRQGSKGSVAHDAIERRQPPSLEKKKTLLRGSIFISAHDSEDADCLKGISGIF